MIPLIIFRVSRKKFPRLRQLATAVPRAQAVSVTAVARARAALLGRRVPSRCADLVAVSVSVGFIARTPIGLQLLSRSYLGVADLTALMSDANENPGANKEPTEADVRRRRAKPSDG